MIPFFTVPSIPLFGAIAIQPFGVMVTIGVVVGMWLARRRAKTYGYPQMYVDDIPMHLVVPAFIAAHVLSILFYSPHRMFVEGPLVLLKIWDELSSFGGFVGGLVAIYVYIRRKHVKTPLKFFDLMIECAFVGQFFGRIGCSLVHDHPGALTQSWLAVQYPGGARFDLGFLEMLVVGILVVPTNLWLRARNSVPGVITAASLLTYGVTRFFLDFLRASDIEGAEVRYWDLTPGQFYCLGFAVVGAGMLYHLVAKSRSTRTKLTRIAVVAAVLALALTVLNGHDAKSGASDARLPTSER